MEEESILTQDQLERLVYVQVQHCPAKYAHSPVLHVPEWAGSNYKHFDPNNPEKCQALSELQRSYQRGFRDPQGRTWCWQCFSRCKLLHLGKKFDYPPLTALLAHGGLPDEEWISQVAGLNYTGPDAWYLIASHTTEQHLAGIFWHFQSSQSN